MERKEYTEEMFVTLADNGILVSDTDCNDEITMLIAKEGEQESVIGNLIFETIKVVCDMYLCNKVKFKITYKPVDD